jgi:glycosyltransferase involved in cell wall biosynthesis
VPTTVIYNISGTIKPPQPPLQQALNGEKIASDLVFGFIGRVEKEKGIETLLMATGQLRQSNWKLKVAGKGLDGYVQKLAERFSDPRIEWLGFTNAAEFYSSVDVVIIPSLLAEALPYVCVESLHAGRSLICALSGGIPEIARLSNIVEFFPSGDADGLAARMNLALASPQQWRECKIPDVSRLSAFREDYVVERYLQEYAPQVTDCVQTCPNLREVNDKSS